MVNKEEIYAKLGEYPIKDAKLAFRCTVTEDDLRRAVPLDPSKCALARTVERYTGNTAIAIYHTKAYIPFTKKGGNKVIERFSLDTETQNSIAEFDRTGKFPLGEYIFLPPPKTARLGAHRKYRNGGSSSPAISAVRVKPRKPRETKLGIRNGTGKVKMVELRAK
jgi:hypothetical protein